MTAKSSSSSSSKAIFIPSRNSKVNAVQNRWRHFLKASSCSSPHLSAALQQITSFPEWQVWQGRAEHRNIKYTTEVVEASSTDIDMPQKRAALLQNNGYIIYCTSEILHIY